MKLIRTFTVALLALLNLTLNLLSAETKLIPGPTNAAGNIAYARIVPDAKLTAPPTNPGKLYTDTFLSLRTPNFSEGDYLYGVGVGYQITRHWAIDARASHRGLNTDGSGVQDIRGRLVARMPFEFLSPYTFLGALFDLETETWRLQPGGGFEIGVNKRLKGLSVFAEGGLDADLKGRSGYLFTGGIRLRF